MKNSIALDHRVVTIRVYGHNADNPEAVAQLSLYGDRGYLWSIKGEQFWKRAEQIAEKVLALGVESLEGYVTPPHARLGRIALSKLGFQYSVGPKKFVIPYGREMCWCVWYLKKFTPYCGGDIAGD